MQINKKGFTLILVAILLTAWLKDPHVQAWASGISFAIIPQAVPTANKIGNSTKFQLGTTGAVSGDCAQFDANLNVVGPGTGAGCQGTSTSSGGIVVYSGLAGVGLSGTLFFPIGGGSAASATETNVDADVQASTTILRFGANLSAALGGGNSVAFTWRKNASDQTLTCTISDPATSCADSVHTFAIVPGDLLSIKAVFTGTIVVAPVFVLATQTGALLAGSITTATGGLAYYASSGTTLSQLPNSGAFTGVEGNGTKVQSFTGSDPATNDCAKFDANHNVVGAGFGCVVTIATGAKALATGAISSATCTAAQTATATGTLTTDKIIANFNGDPTAVTGYIPLTTGMLTIITYPTTDTINFKVCNNTNASITPGAVTLNWSVVR